MCSFLERGRESRELETKERKRGGKAKKIESQIEGGRDYVFLFKYLEPHLYPIKSKQKPLYFV